MSFSLGIDYGTNSVRALIVRCKDGMELGASVFAYTTGNEGVILDPQDPYVARQYPGDYLVGLTESVRGALTQAQTRRGFTADKIIGIGVDTTGSSPLPVDKQNVPLALSSQFRKNLAAQCWLWKDHTSWREAERITKIAAQHRPTYIAKCGNKYSSEWFWSKIWRCLNVAPKVFQAAYSWVEMADWIPSVLAGVKNPFLIKRGICAAGHKALYSEEWGGLPDEEFLRLLHPELAALRERLYTKAYDATEPAGQLCEDWANKLGLPVGIPIAIGEFDVHYGAIGCGIAPEVLVKVIGTSTCDCAIVSTSKKIPDIPGICGIVPGAILPKHYGIEAGQSAVGDIFKWWIEKICGGDSSLYPVLEREAKKLRPGQSGLLALDWNNGNRTILVDPLLTGLLLGSTLQTSQAEVYRALIEATAFGARAIIERLEEYGVSIRRIVCAGGIALKSPMLMQIYADVTGRVMQVAGSQQACALGAAISAAVLAGEHKNFSIAQKAMTSLKSREYTPITANQRVYNQLYALYRRLHDAFGGVQETPMSQIMKELLQIKQQQAG